MTYIVNLENTGLENDAEVIRLAELMQADGHDVEATTTQYGLVNPSAECPVDEDEWFEYLEQASA